MNQESQAVDSTGLIHAIISYVPGTPRFLPGMGCTLIFKSGRFTQCVTNYETDRPAFARPFHVYRSANGTFTKVEIPFAIQSVGRSQIVIDAKGAFLLPLGPLISSHFPRQRLCHSSLFEDSHRQQGLGVDRLDSCLRRHGYRSQRI